MSVLSSDRIPQILDVASELEFNLGTMPRINCAATGNPFPVPGNVELRKPDGTILLVSPAAPAPGPGSVTPGPSDLRPLGAFCQLYPPAQVGPS